MPLTIVASNNAGKALIKIIGRISDWSQNNSLEIGQKVDSFIEQGIKDVKVYIKTEGGSVWEANEIVNIINKFSGKKEGELGALCASAGTYIACHLDTVKMAKNGQYMIHKPKGYFEGNEDEVNSQLQLIKNATADYKKVYAKRTGMTEDEIEALWAKGDVWLSAQQAKAKGFIDEVIGEEEVNATLIEVLRACGAPMIPNIKTENNRQLNTLKMDKTLLGFKQDENPTEEQINQRIRDLNAKAEKAETLIQEAEKKSKEEKEAQIKAILDSAEKERKIKAEQRENYEKLLKSDFDVAKATIEALQPLELLSKDINNKSSETSKKDWTYQDYLDKDPEALNKIRTEKPKEFEALANAHYNEK